MFKRRALQVKMVKTPRHETVTETRNESRPYMSPERINRVVKDQVRHVAIAATAVYAAVVVLNTASEIAINASPKR